MAPDRGSPPEEQDMTDNTASNVSDNAGPECLPPLT